MLACTIIAASIITTCVLLDQFGPPDRRYTDDQFEWGPYAVPEYNASEYNVLLDQHSHTTYSDGVLSPRQNIMWHMAHGYNACVLTDHDNIEGALEARQIAESEFAGEFIVIIGQEWTTSRIHMNLIGITSLVPKPIGAPTDQDIQDAIDATHAQGGLVTVNHIPWSLRQGMDHPSRDDLYAWGVDFIEIVNGGEYDEESANFTHTHPNIFNITGTDMHGPGDVYCWTQVNVSSFTSAAIMAELSAGRTSFIYNSTGSIDLTGESQDNPAYEALKLPILIGDAIEDIYNGGAISIIIALSYLFGVFFIAELLRVVKRKYWAQINAKKASKSS